MKHETKRVRKPPTKCQLILSDEYRDRHGYATKQTWRPSCANQCGCQVPSSPTDPSIQNMVSHDRRRLAALSEPHTEPQIRRLYGHRPIEKRHIGSSPRTPIGRAPYRDLLNLLPSHVDPPFVRVYTEINFRDGGRSAGTSAPSRPTDSPAFHDSSAL